MILSARLAYLCMGNEASGTKRPKQVVEALGLLAGRRMDVNPMPQTVGFLHQAAGEPQACIRARVGVEVEVNAQGRKPRSRGSGLWHARYSGLVVSCRTVLWSSRYCVSSGTGRPVAPLLSPVSQAVPAISRCAQWYFLANLARKQAAVIAPASRPPTFYMDSYEGQKFQVITANEKVHSEIVEMLNH